MRLFSKNRKYNEILSLFLCFSAMMHVATQVNLIPII